MQNDIFSPPKPRVLVSIYIILFTCFMYISSVAQSRPTPHDPMEYGSQLPCAPLSPISTGALQIDSPAPLF